MKMNYLLKSKPKHVHPWKTIAVVLVFVLLSFLGFVFPNILRRISYAIARPLWRVEGVATKTFTRVKDFFAFKNTLISQNLALQDEISSLKLKEIDYDTILKENQDLKNQFGRVLSVPRILASVLSKPPLSPYDTLVIDAGSAEGVVPESKVYLSESIIIGFVTSVTPHASLLKLFSTSGYKQESVLERTGASFGLIGNGGANFSLEVPKDTDILWGDTFMYPGISSGVIATVYYIDTNSQSSFKTIYLRIPGNVFQSRYVFIEKN